MIIRSHRGAILTLPEMSIQPGDNMITRAQWNRLLKSGTIKHYLDLHAKGRAGGIEVIESAGKSASGGASGEIPSGADVKVSVVDPLASLQEQESKPKKKKAKKKSEPKKEEVAESSDKEGE